MAAQQSESLPTTQKEPKPTGVVQEPDHPKFEALLVRIEGRYRKRIGDNVYEFNKYLVVQPAGWNETHHFGQNKEFNWEDFPIVLTQGVVGYVFIGGREFRGEWIPMFFNLYSSWWIDWVQRNFDINSKKTIESKVGRIRGMMKKDMPDTGFAAYFMKMALDLYEEVQNLRDHLDGSLNAERKNEEILNRRAEALVIRHRDILKKPGDDKFDWKIILAILFITGASAFTAWYMGLF